MSPSPFSHFSDGLEFVTWPRPAAFMSLQSIIRGFALCSGILGFSKSCLSVSILGHE
jgi:hypothetical protein